VEEPLLASWMTPFPAEMPLAWPWIAVIVAAVLLVGCVVLRPGMLANGFIWLITHTLYRLRVSGVEHVPATGAALLVCNHVSYIDWLLVRAAVPRRVRFLVWAPYAKAYGMRHLLRWTRAIPIDGSAGPRAIVQALRQASDALAAGDLVCIFAEGGLSRTGFMLPFHRGFEQIVKRTPAPIIPVCLDHVWGSVFSWRGGRILWKFPQELPYPVQVGLGSPMPPTSSAAEVRVAIQKLSADAAIERTARRRPVHVQFVRTAAKRPFARCISDSASKVELNYGKTLAGAMILAKHLRPILGDAPMVGVWLPPSVGGVMANIALSLLHKTSVNLNYTAGPEVVRSSIRQCEIKHVLTSRLFTGKGFKLPEAEQAGFEPVYIEDFRKQISEGERLRAFLKVLLFPGWVLERWVLGLSDHKIDDLATIIFSSGSTGEPKGVMLTHQNIMANAESMIQAIDVDHHDVVVGILPFFHSFGFTVTLWVPLLVGASTVYHHDPRQAKEIGELSRTNGGTILLGTPTFLRFFQRRCEPGDFDKMRILICGAEKLPQPLAKEFQEKFKVLPLEGYGCTELSPVVSTNVPDKELGGTKQIGNKPGTIGQPLPGTAAKIVNPETFEPVPIGQEGLLLIFGANVMKGYLNKPELTKQVIRDGWYVTGDIAKIDEDGFIAITGRLSRFAKVGGEMVPLEKIENELQDILGTSERVIAVAAVPDEKRGERLVVLHLNHNGFDIGKLCEQLTSKGLPNLWVPGERDFFEVSELPLLGSGKLDLQRLKQMALELAKK
jgi:acyl-[acyl-carrier-protein]-phospholipid O-acyltransferase / long-chain-fatty-acid--[acyl-carrier-protein] ligase